MFFQCQSRMAPPKKNNDLHLNWYPLKPITWRVRLQLCGRYPILCTVFSFILSKYLATVVPTIHHESKAKKWPPRLGVDQCLRWKFQDGSVPSNTVPMVVGYKMLVIYTQHTNKKSSYFLGGRGLQQFSLCTAKKHEQTSLDSPKVVRD